MVTINVVVVDTEVEVFQAPPLHVLLNPLELCNQGGLPRAHLTWASTQTQSGTQGWITDSDSLLLLMFYALTKKSKMCLSRTLLSRQSFVSPSCSNAVTGFAARLVQFKREIQFVVGSQKAIKTRDRGQQHSQNFKNISSENI